jgi:hypothetical protein
VPRSFRKNVLFHLKAPIYSCPQESGAQGPSGKFGDRFHLLAVGPPDSQAPSGMRLEAGEQEPQKRQVGIKLTGPTLADHIEKSTFSEDYRVFASHSSRNRNAGLSRASAPIVPSSHELYAVTTERHQSHAGQPPANRVRR